MTLLTDTYFAADPVGVLRKLPCDPFFVYLPRYHQKQKQAKNKKPKTQISIYNS